MHALAELSSLPFITRTDNTVYKITKKKDGDANSILISAGEILC